MLAAETTEYHPSVLLSVAFGVLGVILLAMGVLWWRRLATVRAGAGEVNSLGEPVAPALRPVKDRAMLLLFVLLGALFLWGGAKGIWANIS